MTLTIKQGDALQLYKEIPDNSIDALITDPPYGLSIDNQKKHHATIRQKKPRTKFFGDWDVIPFEDRMRWLESMIPKIKGWALVFCPIKDINGYQAILENKGFKTGVLIWHKHADVLNGKVKFLSCYEPIVWGKRPRTKFFGHCVPDIIHVPFPYQPERETGAVKHPNQKPLKLITKLISYTTAPGMTILDPFLGSGTTAIACEKLGRNCIGFEREEKYCKLIQDRLRTSADRIDQQITLDGDIPERVWKPPQRHRDKFLRDKNPPHTQGVIE